MYYVFLFSLFFITINSFQKNQLKQREIQVLFCFENHNTQMMQQNPIFTVQILEKDLLYNIFKNQDNPMVK